MVMGQNLVVRFSKSASFRSMISSASTRRQTCIFNKSPSTRQRQHIGTSSISIPQFTMPRIQSTPVLPICGFILQSIHGQSARVFFCDAALHAWHRSYGGMLEELEETYLAPTLQTVIQGMGGQVFNLSFQASGTAVSSGVQDADYFLAVTRSLITGTNNYGSLGQNAQILATLTALSNLQPGTVITMFGTNRLIDCSQFQVRGHYATSQRLQRYFRAMMWCGLIDFQFTGSTNDNSLRELSGAVAMHLLMKNSGQFANWQKIDSVVQMFVRLPDSLNFAQFSDLMTAANIQSPSSLPSIASLASLQSQIMAGQIGVQNIQNGYFFSPLSRQQIKLPRAFTVLGQRFVPDAWAMNQCVFDRIIWDTNGIPEF